VYRDQFPTLSGVKKSSRASESLREIRDTETVRY
jgi:hypothetical protein